MATPRDRVKEILGRRTRSGAGRAYDVFAKRIDAIRHLSKQGPNLEDDRARKEILRYYPVATVACLEGFIRNLIAELIDEAPVARRNARRLDIKFDWDVMLSIHNKEITLGEFASHLISINKVKDIEDMMNAIYGITDHSSRLRTHVVRTADTVDLNGWAVFDDGIEFADNKERSLTTMTYADCISSVSKAFNLRHIVAHELAVDIDLDEQDIMKAADGIHMYATALMAFVLDWEPPKPS